jgi:alpha-L-arabinofuranosidase
MEGVPKGVSSGSNTAEAKIMETVCVSKHMAGARRRRAGLIKVGVATLVACSMANAPAAISAPEASQQRPLTIHADKPGPVISRDIFGQFAEQLGRGIYEGVWVGKDSPIPNVRGIRSDVVAALREIKVPNVRWPGGCFADQYHWRNGLGPQEQRKVTYNTNWGSQVEPNSFGTMEYMDFIEQIGSEAYITANVATGTPQEAADWLEYLTADKPTTLVKERAANGHPAPYNVKFFGIGNESYGCGGAMTADAYVDHMKTFALFARNLNPKQSGVTRFMPGPKPMKRIAVGPGDTGTDYTEAVMKAWQGGSSYSWSIEGLSVHRYTSGSKGTMFDPATNFGEKEYATFIKNTYVMDELIATHSAIMDKYDPRKKVSLVIDEWGVWLQAKPGSAPLYLEQQNSLRDALLASVNLNIFARHADRVRMANIAQMINVLQSMIMTDKEKMLLTPTYYTYKMYVPFQDATYLPIEYDAGKYKSGDIEVPQLDVIAAQARDGSVWLALTNLDATRSIDLVPAIPGVKSSGATGEVLTAAKIDAVNTFERPDSVVPRPYKATAKDGKLVLHLAPRSLIVVRLNP